jgi:putative transcriptional regulator
VASSHLAIQKPAPAGLADGTTNTHVRQRIKRLRLLKGWTQRELAHAAGISASSLGCLETGFYRLNLDILQKIIDALGVGIADVWPSRVGINSVESNHAQQRVPAPTHFYRMGELHALTGAEASCLFACKLTLKAPGESPQPELSALYTVNLQENERWWLSQQLLRGTVAAPWVAYIRRENGWGLFLCLKSPSVEPWIEKLIRYYLSDWITALPF